MSYNWLLPKESVAILPLTLRGFRRWGAGYPGLFGLLQG